MYRKILLNARLVQGAIVIQKRKHGPIQRSYKFKDSFIARYINNMVQASFLNNKDEVPILRWVPSVYVYIND